MKIIIAAMLVLKFLAGKIRGSFFILILGFVTSSSFAALYDRGNGMIYDDVLDITWLQDANFALTSGFDADGLMSWAEANEWAQNLSYGGFDDWRLPSITNDGIGDGPFSEVYGTSDIGEIGYMYFVNLGNESSLVNSDCLVAPDGCLQNVSFIDAAKGAQLSFSNIQIANEYWYSNEFPFEGEPPPELPFLDEAAYEFAVVSGVDYTVAFKGGESYGWAVRNGDVTAVPIPAAFWLFGSFIVGLASLKRAIK